MAPSQISKEELVKRVDFCNRLQPSLRCRPAVAHLVSQLAPDCLPAPATFWASPVDGIPVWADLAPRTATNPLDAHLDPQCPEVTCFYTVALDRKDANAARGKDSTKSKFQNGP